MKPDPLAQPDTRPRSADSARLAADVEAFLARGGHIQSCPSGVSADPQLGCLASLIKNETDAASARARLRNMRVRGSRNAGVTKRGKHGRLPQSGA